MNTTAITSLFRVLAIGTALASVGFSESAMASPRKKSALALPALIGNGKSVKKTSGPWSIFPATKYYYSIKGKWVGKGALARAIPNVSNIAQFMEAVQPGSSKYLSGSTDNLSGTFRHRPQQEDFRQPHHQGCRQGKTLHDRGDQNP